MSSTILVINPNSNIHVTEGLDAAMDPLRFAGGPAIECMTLTQGPFGIQSQQDADSVIVPMIDLVEKRNDVSAFVIACYSDPGLDACRSASKKPVFGIQESAVMTALARADLFGVIAISSASVARHRRAMRRMGVLERLAGERSLDMTVDETARGTETFDRLLKVGLALKADGAEIVILGCAGMARHRNTLEEELGIPVIEPTQSAVSMALGTIACS